MDFVMFRRPAKCYLLGSFAPLAGVARMAISGTGPSSDLKGIN